ncbi:MAG: OmpA family protein [Akkermansiaceae bacterium]|nr:OmpA family protein [Akkermansiaceae bacterium]
MEETSSKKPLIYFSGVILAAALFALFLIKKCSVDEANYDASSEQSENLDSIGELKNIGESNVDEATPEELIGQIREVLLSADSEKNAQPLIDYIGKNHFSQSQLQQLKRLAGSSGLKLDSSSPYSRVEGHANRWSLNLADKSKILIDLEKTATGKWQIKKITLPKADEIIAKLTTPQGNKSITPPAAVDQSALITIRKFLNAISKLDAVTAGNYIDGSQVSYATLAGLCIIFEEGDYSLLKDKTLRKMFLKDTSSGWLVRLRSTSTGELAMFSITSKRGNIDLPWKITEINLDNLLSNYAQRSLGGDIYYSPLIKNPKGGDTLAIYFDLDAKNLTNRTKRQLTIVAKILKVSLDKKLTISGHTDSLGSDPYNLSLSRARAEKVMQFLAENGINKEQMEIVGYGKSKPRLPNTTAAGDDSPAGRRANRRAEILLDF